MPFLRQLCTVEIGASVRRETAVVPPSASMMMEASVCMRVCLRLSQTECKVFYAISAVATDANAGFTRPMEPGEIRERLRASGMKQRELAEKAGIDENHLSKSLGKQSRRLTAREVDAIRKVFADPSAIEASGIRTIPLLGDVPAGRFQPPNERSGPRVAVSDPETPPRAYALTVKGDSMDLIVPSGSTVVIDPDDTKLWPGRRYVVRTPEGETTFKEYQDNPARLVPCSSNPEHVDMMLGEDQISVLGRVFSYTMRDVPRRSA